MQTTNKTIGWGIQENVFLRDYTSFKIGGPAKFFLRVADLEDLRQALEWGKAKGENVFVLGGGSNILVSDKGFDGLVVNISNKGMDVLKDSDEELSIKVASGEVWDDVVAKTVSEGWWGVENMSNIPGSAGSFAVQNVGAYGQEASQVVESVEVYDRENGEVKSILASECEFAYRQSIFNQQGKNKYIILNTNLKLRKDGEPSLDYPDVLKYFQEMDIDKPTIKQMREAIVFIRDNKLPNPKEIGSAGSFFKNLVLTQEEYGLLEDKVGANFSEDVLDKLKKIKNKFPAGDMIKIPTAFLLDICGLKGKQVGGAMVYEKQPLILVNNTGQAEASDVLGLAKLVKETVYEKTGMLIVPEPEMVGFNKEEISDLMNLS